MESPRAPTAVPTATRDRRTNACLIAFYVIGVISGFRQAWSHVPSWLDILIPFTLAICLSLWAFEDARRRGRPIPMLAKPWFFLLAPLVIPGYVISSRGWRGLGWLVLHLVLWVVIANAAMLVMGYWLYGEEWLSAVSFQ